MLQPSTDHRPLLARLGVETPALVLDLGTVRSRLEDFRAAIGVDVAIRYAIKCNPTVRLLAALADGGAGFEVASLPELDMALRVGAKPEETIYSAPVKRRTHAAEAYRRGLRWFAAGSAGEMIKLKEVTGPELRPLLRVRVQDGSSRWPQSATWGMTPDQVVELIELQLANPTNLANDDPAAPPPEFGLMFHVGSQAVPGLWAKALERVHWIFERSPVEISVVDLGGGFPVSYPGVEETHIELWHRIGREIADARASLPYQPRRWVAEPGRSLVADAGTMYTTVVDVDRERQMVHTDVGVFNGLYETSEAGGGLELNWRYFDRTPAVTERQRIAGISCDADDVLAGAFDLPIDLCSGEILAVDQAGAYSLSYASKFCGLSTPAVVISEGSGTEPAPYDVALDGSAGFADAVELEYQAFADAGYLEDDGTLSKFRRYDDISRFLLVRSGDGSVVSAVRTVDATPMGFTALHSVPIDDRGWDAITRVGLEMITEVVTLSSSRPSVRSSIVAYSAIWHDTRSRGKDHVLAAIDVRVLGMLERRLGYKITRLGPPLHYMGSSTVGALFDLSDGGETSVRKAALGTKMLASAGSPQR